MTLQWMRTISDYTIKSSGKANRKHERSLKDKVIAIIICPLQGADLNQRRRQIQSLNQLLLGGPSLELTAC